MKIAKQLLDKIFFTFGVIIFLQLPHFINQYTQRIGGFSESQIQQVDNYQSIANDNYNGQIDLLIQGFANSTDEAVRQTGENIKATQDDVELLENEISILENEGLFKKIIFLIPNLRLNIAKGTLNSFQPGIPLSFWAIAYGLFGGILFSLLFNGATKVPRLILRKKNSRKRVFSN